MCYDLQDPRAPWNETDPSADEEELDALANRADDDD